MGYQELVADQTLCTGERKGSKLPCRGSLYKCVACGASGCRQTQNDGCSGQAFSAGGLCLNCGVRNAVLAS
jgi:hypothetical protein